GLVERRGGRRLDEGERVDAGDGDHLVDDGRQGDAVDVAHRDVGGVVRDRVREAERARCSGGATRAAAGAATRAAAGAATRAAAGAAAAGRGRGHHGGQGAQRLAELPGGRDRRDPQLAELVELILEGDHFLRVLLEGTVLGGERRGRAEGERGGDH